MANLGGGQVPKGPPKSSAQMNIEARMGILLQGQERLQQIFTRAVDPAAETLLTINPANVGFCRGFLVKVSGTIRNTNTGASGVALARTPFGASNALKNIGFTDPNNQVRHATQGWHLGLINSAKSSLVFGGAYAPNVPVGYGNNFDVMTCAATLAVATDAEVQFYYYLPLTYTKTDLRGGVWLGIVNATAQLQLEINPTPVVAAGDAGLSIFTGNTGGWKAGTTVQVTVWQDYIDQVPMQVVNGQNIPILPQQDVSTLYQLQVSNMTGLIAGQDFGVPFANFRNFYSSIIVYDNNGVYNAGTDINYFAMQTANASNIWKYGPEEAALLARGTFMADPPLATYYFDYRAKPIATDQFGNTQITINPSAVTAGASVKTGFEYMAQASEVVFAQSLPSGG